MLVPRLLFLIQEVSARAAKLVGGEFVVNRLPSASLANVWHSSDSRTSLRVDSRK